MPQIIVCEWRVIFFENLLHKTVYPLKDPWSASQTNILKASKSNNE